MDEKDTCDGGMPDRSCLDYQRANDIQGADSMMDVHDPISIDLVKSYQICTNFKGR